MESSKQVPKKFLIVPMGLIVKLNSLLALSALIRAGASIISMLWNIRAILRLTKDFNEGKKNEAIFHKEAQQLLGNSLSQVVMAKAYSEMVEVDPTRFAWFEALQSQGVELVVISNTNPWHWSSIKTQCQEMGLTIPGITQLLSFELKVTDEQLLSAALNKIQEQDPTVKSKNIGLLGFAPQPNRIWSLLSQLGVFLGLYRFVLTKTDQRRKTRYEQFAYEHKITPLSWVRSTGEQGLFELLHQQEFISAEVFKAKYGKTPAKELHRVVLEDENLNDKPFELDEPDAHEKEHLLQKGSPTLTRTS